MARQEKHSELEMSYTGIACTLHLISGRRSPAPTIPANTLVVSSAAVATSEAEATRSIQMPIMPYCPYVLLARMLPRRRASSESVGGGRRPSSVLPHTQGGTL